MKSFAVLLLCALAASALGQAPGDPNAGAPPSCPMSNPPLAPNMVDSAGSYGSKDDVQRAIDQKMQELSALRSELQNPKYNQPPPPVMPYSEALEPVEEWIDNFNKRVGIDYNDPETIAQPFVDRLARKHEHQEEQLHDLNEKLRQDFAKVAASRIEKELNGPKKLVKGQPNPGLNQEVGLDVIPYGQQQTQEGQSQGSNGSHTNGSQGGTNNGSTANGSTANGSTANGSTANGSTANGSTAGGSTATASQNNGSTGGKQSRQKHASGSQGSTNQ